MSTSFTVASVFEITGRAGTVVSRPKEDSMAAWAAGERWAPRDMARCSGLVVRVLGIERFAVPEGHPNHFDGSLILDVEPGLAAPGQIWERVGRVDDRCRCGHTRGQHRTIDYGLSTRGVECEVCLCGTPEYP